MNKDDILFAGQKALQVVAVMLGLLDLARALPLVSFCVAFMQEASWVVGP